MIKFQIKLYDETPKQPPIKQSLAITPTNKVIMPGDTYRTPNKHIINVISIVYTKTKPEYYCSRIAHKHKTYETLNEYDFISMERL